MGKRCADYECPYLADDGTCLLPKYELSEKCPAREHVEHEEKDDWLDEAFIMERLRSLGVVQ